MKPLIDPRAGDVEDDRSSTKNRKLAAIAGSMLAEISLLKFVVAWLLLVAVPGLVLGFVPLIVTAWFSNATEKFLALSGLGSLLLLGLIAAIGLFGGHPLFRIAEKSFWSLNSLGVQPAYAITRESLRHLSENWLNPGTGENKRVRIRSFIAFAAGVACCAFGLGFALLIWPQTEWTGQFADLAKPHMLIFPAIANSCLIISVYFAIASLVWGLNDAWMHQPRSLESFDVPSLDAARWRIVHISDVHTVGGHFGFRIESGRAGPRGNQRLERTFELLAQLHERHPVDVLLWTGDVTDAGLSSEWAVFFDMLERYPALAERSLILPGNHDVNVADKTNPARLELPMSPSKRLRQMRALCAMAAVQGERTFVYDRHNGRVGRALNDKLEPHRATIAQFSDTGMMRHARVLAPLWEECFPLVVPPQQPDGLGIIILNSNAETNFSFTNALGLVSADDVSVTRAVMRDFPQARWIVAMHHHVVEYPMKARKFAERVGTALINGSWFVRQLSPMGKRLLIMHGHRHTDWIGRCGTLKIVSAPSPVMNSRDHETTCFHVHTLAAMPRGALGLMPPERIDVPGIPEARP